MAEKPELIVFGQYKLGGIQSFYYNILSNDPYRAFDIRWIFVDIKGSSGTNLLESYGCAEELVFETHLFQNEDIRGAAARLEKLISDRPGAAVTNLEMELATLYLYPKKNKTVYFICHDHYYLENASRFAFLIDVFIAHNPYYYERMIKEMPSRKDSIFYMPYGVKIPGFARTENTDRPLKVVIAARLTKEKGVYDLPIIDDLLKRSGITVQWTIIGDGPEKAGLQELLLPRGNSVFKTLPDNPSVVKALAENDVFILPSRMDGLPAAMLEAMSVGCVPILANFNEGIRKVVTKDIGFVHVAGDNKAFAGSIAFLDSHRSELEKRSLAAREKIGKDYNITQRAREYFDLFGRYAELKVTPEKRRALYGENPIDPLKPRRPKWTTVLKTSFLRLFPFLRAPLKRAAQTFFPR